VVYSVHSIVVGVEGWNSAGELQKFLKLKLRHYPIERTYFSVEEIHEIQRYLLNKVISVYAGIEEFTVTDKFAHFLIKEIYNLPPLDEQKDKETK
jgi:hypothetical protein